MHETLAKEELPQSIFKPKLRKTSEVDADFGDIASMRQASPWESLSPDYVAQVGLATEARAVLQR